VTRMADHERLHRCVERLFAKSEKTRFPTVREVARVLRWKQARVEATVEGDPDERLFLTSYFTVVPEPLAEHFVESYG